MQGERRRLYPPIEPYATGRLGVSGPHEIYHEESGNAQGQPVVFLHGGPGGGSDPKVRRFFDPEHYRIVVFDQRGCGRSTPHACLEENTTWDLCRDIERLRQHLGIARWLVFGGSWGSTLALAYAQTSPESVTGLILRGVFLGRQREFDWLYRFGASELFPDRWDIMEGLRRYLKEYLKLTGARARRRPATGARKKAPAGKKPRRKKPT